MFVVYKIKSNLPLQHYQVDSMDIALTIDRLLPAAEWEGSVTEDFIQRAHNGDYRAGYEAIVWNDARPKPDWREMTAEWDKILAEPPVPEPPTVETLEERLTVVESDIAVLKVR